MKEYSQYLFKSFAKTTGLSARLYKDRTPVYYYSSTHLFPDPVSPQLERILLSPHRAGVIMMPLYQHYGFAHLNHGYMLILGPTAALNEDPMELDQIAFLLGVSGEEKTLYLRRLCCAPEVSAERLAWILSFFVTAMEGKVFGVEQVHIETEIVPLRPGIARTHASESFESYENTDLSETVLTSYRFERIGNLYVKNGQVEQLIDLFEAVPKIKAGKMAKDALRQTKNMFICAATTMSRAAIDGGLEPQSAFKLSDLYIQKSEILREPTAITSLMQEMVLDFAARVRALNYGNAQDSQLFQDCARYVKQHLFSRILVQDVAEHLGISKAYLSTRFHAITGKNLSQFILEQKMNEAMQLLRYSNKSIADISSHLAFSSQSHFQNAFKKQTEVTPLEYRRQYR